ncbi:zinc-binding dehydrogenase, partial [Pseudomonas sp. SIMBA_059]
ISLAIPIDEAMRVVDQLRATGKVTRGRVGVQIGEVGKDVAEAIGLPKAEGALVSSVEVDGPAEQAGVQPGDVILFHAAAGGVGSLACQWANALGAKLIGTVSSAEKAERAKALGAWETIDYSHEDVAKRVLE